MDTVPVITSSADAKEIIRHYSYLDEQYHDIGRNYASLEFNLSQKYKVLVGKRSTIDCIELSLKTKSNEFACPEYKDFLHALSLCDDYSKHYNRCKQLFEKQSSWVPASLALMEKASSSLRWIFIGSHEKDKVREAYRRLASNDEYEKAISEAHRAIGADFTQQVVDKYILYHYSSCASIIKKLREQYPDSLSTPISTLLRIHRPMAEKANMVLQTGKREEETLQTKIIEQAQQLLLRTALQELQQMDVESLSMLRSGLRIKALKDNGYTNVAKVHLAPIVQLASINGISYETAVQIKEAANEISSKLTNNTRVRVSADDQNNNATLLVSATFQLFRLRASLNELATYISSTIDQVKGAIIVLEPYSSIINYLIADNLEPIWNAYQFLSSLPITESPIVQNAEIKSEANHAAAWDDFLKRPVEYNTLWQEIAPDLFGISGGEYGLPEELAREVQDQAFFPEGLKVTLRRYQEWGVKYALHQGKIILGDEMGLGKTIQAIATMVSLKNTGASHFLVVCPASVLPNWSKEVQRKSAFEPIQIYGSLRNLALEGWVKSGGVAITTYETASQIKLLESFQFDLLVVDEAHYIKNPEAIRSKAVVSLSTYAKRIIFLTGTPLENKVEEMITLIKVINPSVANSVKNVAYLSTAAVFRELIAPVYYRRKREDVLQELPEKEEMDTWVELMSKERELYKRAILNKNQTNIRRVSWQIGDPVHSSKAQRLKEIVDEAATENRRVIAFSFYKDTLRMLQHFLGSLCVGVIDGSVPIETRQAIIDDFENRPGGSVILAQINAGGTGLNIQSASVVIICEPQLKPSIEDQAISRAYRMGQARKVLVYRLLASNTIDERITDLLEEKRQAFLAFADRSVAAETTDNKEIAIEDKTFGKLIQEEIDRINQENGVQTSTVSKPINLNNSEASLSKSSTPKNKTRIVPAFEQGAKQNPEIDKGAPIPTPVTIHQSNENEKTPETIASFKDIEAFIRYMNDEEIFYVDNRFKNGCLWVASDGETDRLIKSVRINGQAFQYAISAKALGSKPAWYLS